MTAWDHKPAQYNRKVFRPLDILWWLFIWPMWLWIKLEERQAMRLMTKDQRLKFIEPIEEDQRALLEKCWSIK